MNGLLIGRFQPFHLGHVHAVRFALSKVDNLWIGIGSSNRSHEKYNPFSASERKEMILSSLDDTLLEKIKIFEIPDFDDHKRWAENIKTLVPKFSVVFTNDETTAHIYSRQGIDVLPIPFEDRDFLSGTRIRQKIIQDENWQDYLPEGTKKVLIKSGAKDRIKGL